MGATLVKVAFATLGHHADVSAPARLVLLKMALTAKDTDTTPLFWGGRDELAQAAGYPASDADSASARRHVRRLVDSLVSAGLVVRIGSAHPGRNQTYALRLGDIPDPPFTPPTPREADPMGDVTDPPFGGPVEPLIDPNGGSERSAMGDVSDPPEERREEPSTTRTHASGFAEEAALVGSDEDAMHADDDDPYLKARRTLLTLDPEQVEAAQQRINVDMPHASTRERVMATLRILEDVAS